ncbi:hypothetical protein Micbo1qcDRAFT_181011 [Microdochium bolleyi]|uniref:Uncharacterized protein n=1 Tax=Microdochium bolleyi TaxID=196109 RepID=A0A136IKC0_9PEZI|nr:hypothetical protein Micbo1qcDRAFT_181011 [Microdochium bolleyi]
MSSEKSGVEKLQTSEDYRYWAMQCDDQTNRGRLFGQERAQTTRPQDQARDKGGSCGSTVTGPGTVPLVMRVCMTVTPPSMTVTIKDMTVVQKGMTTQATMKDKATPKPGQTVDPGGRIVTNSI